MAKASAMNLAVDCHDIVGPLGHFWESTGFTPARMLLNPDMQQTLAYVGSIPCGGIKHVRIHFLLDLVWADGLGTARPRFDWSRLDQGLDVLVGSGLRPFFELMGNPGGHFTDFGQETQLDAWRSLVSELARHCIAR